MNERVMHICAGLGTVAIAAGLLVPTLYAGGSASADAGPNIDKLESIEASLAYSSKPMPQPQKQFRAPNVEKADGVSHDADKAPDPAKPETKPDKAIDQDISKALDKYRRADDPDAPVGSPTQVPAPAFDGSQYGFDMVTKGDPFFQKLKADLRWDYPQILDGTGVPIGCFHLEADGKIVDILFKQKSGNDDLDDSVLRALNTLKKARTDNPVPVPQNLLQVTGKWVCFQFKLDK